MSSAKCTKLHDAPHGKWHPPRKDISSWWILPTTETRRTRIHELYRSFLLCISVRFSGRIITSAPWWKIILFSPSPEGIPKGCWRFDKNDVSKQLIEMLYLWNLERRLSLPAQRVWVPKLFAVGWRRTVLFLEANGIQPTTKLFPPKVVKYLCEKYDIDL